MASEDQEGMDAMTSARSARIGRGDGRGHGGRGDRSGIGIGGRSGRGRRGGRGDGHGSSTIPPKKKPSCSRDSCIVNNGCRNPRGTTPSNVPCVELLSSGGSPVDLLSSGSGGSPDNESDDCVIVEATVAPSEFHSIPPQRQTLMLKKLNQRNSDANVHSLDQVTMKTVLDDLITNRDVLLVKAREKDQTTTPNGEIASLLQDKIPFSVAKNIAKSRIAEFLVKSWNVMSYFLKNVKLSRKLQRDLEMYTSLMERIDSACEAELVASADADKNATSFKLSARALGRCYLIEGSKPGAAFPKCAKCGHTCHDEPKKNKVAAKNNININEKWLKDKITIGKWLDGTGPPLLGMNGQILQVLTNPKHEPEVIQCHCSKNYQSITAGRAKCLLSCYDKKTGIQHDPGDCPICKCSCS